jgi:hypothetical protein
VPLGPAANVTGDSLGVQADYRKHTTKAFKISLERGGHGPVECARRRVLFVIGDGEDQSDNASINDEIKKLEDASIEVYVLGANPRGRSIPRRPTA